MEQAQTQPQQLDPIIITPEQDAPTPVFLADDTAPLLPPKPEVANIRSDKAYIGLGQKLNQSKEEIRAMIASGREQEYRDSAASNLTFQAAQKKEQALVDAVKTKGSRLSYEEALKIVDPFNPANKPADPKDVIERAYAEGALSTVSTAAAYMQGTVLSDAAKEIPEQIQNTQNKTSELVTKMEFAKTLKQNIDNEIEHQGVLPWAADIGKTMFQPYVEYKMRSVNPNVGFSGGLLLGDNLQRQADQLFMQPIEDFKNNLPKYVAELRKDNPTLASKFLDYVIGNASSDRVLDNVFTILAPMDYASVFNISKSLARKISVNNRANNAFKQIVKEAAKETDIPTKAVLEEAAGDVKSAGATRAADEISKVFDNTLDPIQDIKGKLTSNFRLDGDIHDTNPGKLSRHELTVLKDSFYNAGNKLFDTIMDMLRVNRTPVPLASEEALKAYQTAVRGQHPGEIILDIGSPIREPVTNTYHIPFTYGNQEGRLFSDAETAYNYARSRGYANPRILSETGEVEKEAGKLVGTKTDLAKKARLEKSIPATERLLETYKDFVSRKFVGPRRPEDIKDAKERIESIKEILVRDKQTLEEISKRVITSDPVIEQNGLGYKFVVIRPYKETDDVVRSYLINSEKSLSSASQQGFSSWKNSFLGYIRGADDTLSYNETLQRKVATYTQSLMHKWAKDEAKAIEAIASPGKWYNPFTWARSAFGGSKQAFKEFEETLAFAKTAKDAEGKQGYFFRTAGELHDHYQRYYQRIPSFAETQAYFAHVRLIEGNRILSEIAEFRNRARLGAEQHQLFTLGADGSRVGSEFFDGIQQKEFPNKGQMMVMGERLGEEKLFSLGRINTAEANKYKEWVESGKARLIRIYDPDSHPLNGFSDVAGTNRIRYILTTDSEVKPLDFNHVNRRGGGHFEVDADYYIKQANMVSEVAGDAATDKRSVYKRIYTGDNTLMPIGNRALGRDVAEMMNQMNGHMKNARIDEAKSLARKLGIDWERVEGWYDQNRIVNGKKVGAYINWDEPFYVVPRNRKVYDLPEANLENRVGKDLWEDGTRSGSDAQQFQVAYNQARDSELMHTIKDVGTQGNPIYKLVQADYVDPIPTMNMALNRAIRSTFMDDYKIHAVEHWLAEAIQHLKADETEIRSAPFWHFNNADRGAFKIGDPATTDSVINNLLSNRFKISQFVGMPNQMETTVHGLTQLLADSFYKKLGPEESRSGITKASTIVPLWALSKWQDPVSGIRSLAFNAKLGLFAIPQFFVQAQTFTSIIALSPRAGLMGTYASMLHQWSRVNSSEKFMKAFDDYASKLNMFGSRWKAGEWTEARRELARSGFEHVGGEYQLADDQMLFKPIQSKWNNFLDAGQLPFREGEKFSRLGAYYTAFREFRDANPIKILTDADRAAILNRADTLTVNMSRASASKLDSGIFSLPKQFLTYQIRMAELFFGQRIGETTAERVAARARLLSFYAAIYGAPSALGITGYPFGDTIRQTAINNGYVVGDKFLSSLIMEGIPAWTMAMVSGGGDIKKGNWYNFGDRYGSQGFTALRESFRSDKTVWSLLGGAGVDTLLSTIGNFDPFWQFAKQLVSPDEQGNTFKVTPTHLVKLTSEISSADAVTRFVYAMNSGKWLSKNESYIEDVTGKDALFRTITGLKSQGQDDIFAIKNIKDAEEKVWKTAEKEIIKDFRRGLQATEDKDYDTATTYFTNARARMVAAGIPVDRRSEIYALASRGNEKQIERSRWTWATKNVPAGQEAARLDAMTRHLQIQNQRQ